MPKASPQLTIAAIASALATAALALSAPGGEHGTASGASMVPAMAELPAPSLGRLLPLPR